MNNIDLNEVKNFLNKAVDKSGDIIRKHYRNLSEIEVKDDLSPVTVADREVERLLREMIKEAYPDHGIQGEEYGSEGANSDYKWLIDPIDGTASFMIGRPTFGTLVGLAHKGIPLAGVIDQPINKERWLAAKGQGATFNGSPIKVRDCGGLEEATVCTTGPNYFSEDELFKFSKVSLEARYTIYGGDCYQYGLLALGHIDLVVEAGLKPHDFFPFITIIREAGGIITDWQGRELNANSKGDIIAACSKKVHEQVVEILK